MKGGRGMGDEGGMKGDGSTGIACYIASKRDKSGSPDPLQISLTTPGESLWTVYETAT